MLLPIRAAAVHDQESLKGLLLRVSAANRFPDFRWLLDMTHLPPDFATRRCDLTALAHLIGVAPADVAAAACWPVAGQRSAVTFGPTTVSPSALDLVHPKVCVICLAGSGDIGNNGVARRVWDLRVAAACAKHGCLLVDVCPHCGGRLTWRRPSLDRCRCKGSLLATGPASAPPGALAIARLLEILLGSAGRRPDLPKGAAPVPSLDAAARLVWFFGTSAASADRAWRSLFMSKPSLANALPILERGAPILVDWPDGLFAWLAGRRRPAAERVGLTAEFGPLLRRMRAGLRGPEFAFLFDAVRRWLADEWDGGFVKPWSFFHARPSGSARRISGVTAARELGVTGARVAAMIARGELRGESRRMGRRRLHIVEAGDLAAAKHRRNALLSKPQVADRLGISVFQVQALHGSGLLHGVVRPHAGLGFERRAVEALAARLSKRSRPPLDPGTVADAVTLSQIPKLRVARLVEVLDAILAGTVPLYRGDAGDIAPVLARFWVERTRLLGRGMGMGGEGPCFGVRETATRLGIAVRMVPILVRAGCLEASRGAAGAGRLGKRSVTAASVEAFPSRYRLSRTLAATYRTSTRRIVSELTQAGISPAVAADTGRGISAVWRVADLESMNLRGRIRPQTAQRAS